MTDLGDQVHLLLLEARQLDEWASEVRASVGQLLLDAAGGNPLDVQRLAPQLGVDRGLARLLTDMAESARIRRLTGRPRRSYPAAAPERPH